VLDLGEMQYQMEQDASAGGRGENQTILQVGLCARLSVPYEQLIITGMARP